MEETPLEAIPTFTPRPRQTNKRSVYIILAIVIIVLLFLGYKVLSITRNSSSKPSPIPTIAVSPTLSSSPASNAVNPSLSPSPGVSPTVNPIDKDTGLDRSQLSVTVENGNGTAGVAAKGVSF